MEKMIYFDMDGTIANLYKGEWLNDIINGNVRPYVIADRMIDEDVLIKLEENGYKLGVITWLAKGNNKEYDKMVRVAKKEWLKKNYPNIKFEHIHIVKYGTPKQKFANVGDILVDDEKPNRDNWKYMAIEPNEIYNLI